MFTAPQNQNATTGDHSPDSSVESADETGDLQSEYSRELTSVREELYLLRAQHNSLKFTWNLLESPKQCHFYTGLSNANVFSALFKFVSCSSFESIDKTMMKLSLKDELFMVLVKLTFMLMTLAKRKGIDVDFATLDKIMVVCAALVNLGDGVVPSNEQE